MGSSRAMDVMGAGAAPLVGAPLVTASASASPSASGLLQAASSSACVRGVPSFNEGLQPATHRAAATTGLQAECSSAVVQPHLDKLGQREETWLAGRPRLERRSVCAHIAPM